MRAERALPRSRRRAGLILPAILGAVAIAFGIVGALSLPGSSTANGPTGKDLRGNTVQLDIDVPLPPAASSAPKASDGGRLIVPSVGLNVPLGSLNEVDGVIVPPGFTSAYRVRNRGVPVSNADQGTVFVVMHALRGGALGPGNYVTDIKRQRSKVAQGAVIDVAGTKYRVTESQRIGKTKIPYASDVWADTPNRLVLITCLEHPDDSPSTDNIVIIATRIIGE